MRNEPQGFLTKEQEDRINRPLIRQRIAYLTEAAEKSWITESGRRKLTELQKQLAQMGG